MEEKKVEVLEEPKKENGFEEIKFQEVEIKREKKEVRIDSYFDGKVLELIGWKLLAYLITCVSAGIAYPWGKCMEYKYQFSHTVYNGKRLKFEGNGGDLFVNRFKWIFFTIITFGIYGWWVPAKKANWVISNIHFEDEEFKKDESFFEEKGIKLFWLNLLCKFLNIISVGLLIPFTFCLKMRYINRNTVINRKKLVFTGEGIKLLGKYILWGLLTCVTFGIYGWWLPLKYLEWQTSKIHIKRVGEEEEIAKKEKESIGKTILILIPILIGALLILGLIIWLFLSTFSGFDLGTIFNGYSIDETINGWKYCEKGWAYSQNEGGNPQCYKIDKTLDTEQCENLGGHNGGSEGYCYIYKGYEKKPNNGLSNTNNDANTKTIITEPYSYEEESKSQCPEGWYYVDYYGKCAKDITTTYEECEKQNGNFAGYDTCTIYQK